MILEEFIGIFPNTLTTEECQDYINYFNKLDSMGLIYERTDPAHIKKDKAYNIIGTQLHSKETSGKLIVQHIYPRLLKNYKIYSKYYSVLQDYNHHDIYDIKLQKTAPGEGYHIWHCEHGIMIERNRIAAWSVFLNTVEEGGETEFLYQKKRYSPVAGTMMIWPAGYTHVHRGNPPLKKDKFIMTGWLEFGP
jgi:hypothetical protein